VESLIDRRVTSTPSRKEKACPERGREEEQNSLQQQRAASSTPGISFS